MDNNSKNLHIGIASHCDLYTLKHYLFEEYHALIKPNANYATSVTNLVKGLLESGVRVTLFTLSTSLSEQSLKGANLEIYVIPSCNSYPGKYIYGCWFNGFKIKKTIEQHLNNIDIIHAHWTYEYAWAAGNFTSKLPVVCSVRDIASYIWKKESIKNKITWTLKVFMNWLVFQNKKINFISNSEYTANEVLKTWKRKTLIIPNSIKNEFLKEKTETQNLSSNIISIAQNVDKRKNLLPLLHAFQDFKRNKNTSLWLVGGVFTEKNPIMKNWKALGLLEGVVLMGSLDNIKLIQLLDECEMMVHPSLEETFGNTIIEAMARKVPVIAGINSGAVPYILGNGKLGFLANVSSSEDIKGKMEFIYNNKNATKQLTSQAYQNIKENYSLKVVIEAHIDLYKNLII